MTEEGKVESVERESIKKVAIVVLGRGVRIGIYGPGGVVDEKREEIVDTVKIGDGSQLMPTGLLERVVKKVPEKGNFGPEEHPAMDWPVYPETDDTDDVRYAGAEENVEAAEMIARKVLADPNKKLTEIYWAAGRTPDVDAYAPEGWTQGMVLAKKFVNDMGGEIQGRDIKMNFEPENKNTWDDLAASLLGAAKADVDEIVVVTVGVHMPRTEKMTEEVLAGMKVALGEDHVPKVTYQPSEELLMDDKGGEIRKAQGTEAFRLTQEREQNGIKAMEAGTYKSQWADGGKVAEFNKPVQVMSVDEVRNFK